MSTKTTLKRIALVAVSALGFGLLSVVPGNATISGTSATGSVDVTLGTASAVNAITLITSAGNYNQYSSFALYGVKGA